MRTRKTITIPTEWDVLCPELARLFTRHRAPVGFFDSYGFTIFKAAKGRAYCSERTGMLLGSLVAEYPDLTPRLLVATRAWWLRKRSTTTWRAVVWMLGQMRILLEDDPRPVIPWSDEDIAVRVGGPYATKQGVRALPPLKLATRHKLGVDMVTPLNVRDARRSIERAQAGFPQQPHRCASLHEFAEAARNSGRGLQSPEAYL